MITDCGNGILSAIGAINERPIYFLAEEIDCLTSCGGENTRIIWNEHESSVVKGNIKEVSSQIGKIGI